MHAEIESKGSVTRASPQLTSSSWYHPSPNQPTNMAGESTYGVIVREIARSWHEYLP